MGDFPLQGGWNGLVQTELRWTGPLVRSTTGWSLNRTELTRTELKRSEANRSEVKRSEAN